MRFLFYFIHRLYVWLLRSSHSRGFGVQSPSAYSFIRYVINEHYPYYAYNDLKHEFPNVSHAERRLCRLYFRIANYAQASSWFSYGVDSRVRRYYIQGGCNSTSVVYSLQQLERISIADVLMTDGYATVIESVLSKVSSSSILIIEGIHDNRENKRYWNQLIEDKRCGVSYDLYYCGIIFFDLSKYKQHYLVNF